MLDNPLLRIRFEIPFDQIQPEHVEPAIQALIAEAEAELQSILESPRNLSQTR